jgi:hypothetical protein
MPPPPDLPPPTLEVYYSPSCTPCRLELPLVAETVGRQDLRVRIVIVDEEERARMELRAVSPRLDALAESRAGASPNATLREAGNARSILPYARTVAVNGETCSSWAGGLTKARIDKLRDACLALIASPRRSRP